MYTAIDFNISTIIRDKTERFHLNILMQLWVGLQMDATSAQNIKMKKPGLVGGISWVSTIEYYKLINEGVNKQLGGLHFGECIIYSIDFGRLQERGWIEACPLLLDACLKLEACGAEGIVLCANTAHLHMKAIRQRISIPVIDIIQSTAVAIEDQGVKRVGLLGTKFVMESDLYVEGLSRRGVDVLVPESLKVREQIQHTLKEELGKGIFEESTKLFYLNVIKELAARGAEAIVMGCTEIPLMISHNDTDIPLFDTTKIHAEAVVEFMLS